MPLAPPPPCNRAVEQSDGPSSLNATSELDPAGPVSFAATAAVETANSRMPTTPAKMLLWVG